MATTTISGTTDLEDVNIRNSAPTDSYGGWTWAAMGLMAAGNEYALLFKVGSSAIPSGSITAARWLMFQANSGQTAGSADSYRVVRSWTEGTLSGTNPAPGAGATWNGPDDDTPSSWGTAGCKNNSTDYTGSAICAPSWGANASPPDVQATFTFSDASVFEGWRDGDFSNYGWVSHQNSGAGTGFWGRSTEYGSNEPTVEIDVAAAATSGTPTIYSFMRRRR